MKLLMVQTQETKTPCPTYHQQVQNYQINLFWKLYPEVLKQVAYQPQIQILMQPIYSPLSTETDQFIIIFSRQIRIIALPHPLCSDIRRRQIVFRFVSEPQMSITPPLTVHSQLNSSKTLVNTLSQVPPLQRLTRMVESHFPPLFTWIIILARLNSNLLLMSGSKTERKSPKTWSLLEAVHGLMRKLEKIVVQVKCTT